MKSAGINDDPVKRAFFPVANRDSADGSGGIWHQGRGILVVPPGLDARAEVVQHLLALPPAGVYHRQHTLHEPASLRAVRAATGLPQQHAMPFRTLSLVVRWLHPFDVNKRPQPLFVTQQFLAGPRRFAAPALCAALQHLRDRRAHGLHGLLQTWPRQLTRTELIPQVKQPVSLFQQTLTDDLTRLAPVNHRLEVTPQMRPTPLQLLDPPIRLQPVASSHARVLVAQPPLGYLCCPALGDAKQSGPRRHRSPQVRPFLLFTPGCLIDVDVLR